MLMEVGREHQPVAEVPVVGEHELVIEISHHGVGEIGLNPLDEVAVVDPALNPVLAERHERDRPDASPFPYSLRVITIGFAFGISAALRQPCGVSHTSNCRCSASAGAGTTMLPFMFQAKLPLTNCCVRCSPANGLVMAGRLPPPAGPP